jgi:hypothetical protein
MVSATSVCYIKGPVEMRSQLNRLLAQWLAPPTVHAKQLHSLMREWVISLVHLHVLSVAQSGQEEDARSDSPTSVDIGNESNMVASCIGSIKPLVSLLVKILVDSRTRTVHRRNVASVVIRLLHNNDHCTANDSSVYKISLAVQQMVAMEVQQVLKLNVMAQRRKRKRNKTSNDDDTISRRRRRPPPWESFASIRCRDWMVCSLVLFETWLQEQSMARVVSRIATIQLETILEMLTRYYWLWRLELWKRILLNHSRARLEWTWVTLSCF